MGREDIKERYARIVIDLSVAHVDEEIDIVGEYVYVGNCTGTTSTTYFKLNHRNAQPIYPGEVTDIKGMCNKIYMTNAAEAGKELVLYVGSAVHLTSGFKCGDLAPCSPEIIDAVENRQKNACRAYHSASVSIPDNAYTKVTGRDVEVFDLNNEYASDRFTAKTAGYYQVNTNEVIFDLGLTKKFILMIYKNGVAIGMSRIVSGNVSNQTYGCFCATLVYLAVNDYIETYVYQNHGAARNLQGAEIYNSISIFRVI